MFKITMVVLIALVVTNCNDVVYGNDVRVATAYCESKGFDLDLIWSAQIWAGSSSFTCAETKINTYKVDKVLQEAGLNYYLQRH